ncbi:MAG: hypothetical protein AAB573_04910 [Patescibacteria group bacterium]
MMEKVSAPNTKRSTEPRPRGTNIKRRAQAPTVEVPVRERPLTLSSASVIESKNYSKVPQELRSVARRNKFEFYNRSDTQLTQFGKIRRSYL